MNLRKTLLPMLALTLSLSPAGDASAGVSQSAVQFLRVAPGSRAAGMGEAFVAIADDATATHWNPAGLGSYPLADTWIESSIPEENRPIRGYAPLSTGGSTNYLDYDIWAITPVGLIRYDNKNWHAYEVFSTRTDETVQQKVKSYFNVTDEARLVDMVDRVAELNNRGSYDELAALRDSVLAAIPDDYDAHESLLGDFDSLLVCYSLCRVNWNKVREMRKRLSDGLKDSTLNDTECDRISVALERSRNRFLPEELRIPYSALFTSEPTAIASTGEVLLVGSADGLARYNGTNWQEVKTDDGMALENIAALHVVGGSILVATDHGVRVFDGLNARPLTTDAGGLPDGVVEAIGGSSLTCLYAAVNGRLFHYDGRLWSSVTTHTVAVDESLEDIAANFSIYGTEADKQRFIDHYKKLQKQLVVIEDAVADAQVDTITEHVSPDSTGSGETPATEESETLDATTPEPETKQDTVQPPTGGVPGIDVPLNPGDEIQVPMVAGVKGKIRSIHVDFNEWVWLGTDHGVFYFDGHRWLAPGYEDHQVAEGETLETLAERRSGLSEEEVDAYRTQLADLNDLGESQPVVGTTVKLYANPAARPINSIAGDGRRIFFATDNGLVEFDGRDWSRSSLRGLTRANIVGINVLGSESWIASDEKLVIKGRGRSEAVLMHVKWLPELADDMYYEFLSLVTNKEGWGTFGVSITYLSMGKIVTTDETGYVTGEISPFDFAAALSYGSSLTHKLKVGLSAKVIYSSLTPQGAGKEVGEGKGTAFGIDLGLLYHMNPRLTWGLAVTNLGPKIAYIDAEQSDPLPRNLAFGLSYKLLQSDYVRLLATVEMNKELIGLNESLGKELEEAIINGGAEFTWIDLISFRMGYLYDQEGAKKLFTIGAGLSPFSWGELDFALIPSQKESVNSNTLRTSLRIIF